MAPQEPQRVSAAEFIRGFASWRLRAARRPVVVTHHGRDAHVLISLDDYRRLGDPVGPTINDLDRSRAAVIEGLRDAVLLVGRDGRIVAANPAACDMVEAAAADLIGRDPIEVLGQRPDGPLTLALGRMLGQRERFSADIPGLLRPGGWMHVDMIPVPAGGALILRDISAAIDGAGQELARLALSAAIDAHGAIGIARLSVREAVEDANEALLALTGTDPLAIRRVRFSALLTAPGRPLFAEAVDDMFRSGIPRRIEADMMTRSGAAAAVTLSLAEIRGPYASEGAVVTVTPRR